jgi:hypothetical protein
MARAVVIVSDSRAVDSRFESPPGRKLLLIRVATGTRTVFMTEFSLLLFLLMKNESQTRVAGWFIFKPKIQIWVHFEGPWNGNCFIFYDHFGICYAH